MKRFSLSLLLSLAVFVHSSSTLAAQETAQIYDGIASENKKIAVFDGGMSAFNTWKISDFQQVERKQLTTTVTQVKSQDAPLTFWQDLILSQEGKDFEIEARLKINRSKDNEPTYLVWEGSKDNFLGFGITPDKKYQGILCQDGQISEFIPKSTSLSIRENDFNKVTIRKFEGGLYFFINETLIAMRKSPKPFGMRFGVLVGAKTDMELDFLLVQEVGEFQKNLDFLSEDSFFDETEKSSPSLREK